MKAHLERFWWLLPRKAFVIWRLLIIKKIIKKLPLKAFKSLQNNFSKANFNKTKDVFQENALAFFAQDFNADFDNNSNNNKNIPKIKLHLKGTDFQLKVWEMLLKIPLGELSTYGNIAEKINNPNATRAVGTAIGKNPVAFLIPCHRVIQASGMIGGYMWGTTRKTAIIGWEAAKKNFELEILN